MKAKEADKVYRLTQKWACVCGAAGELVLDSAANIDQRWGSVLAAHREQARGNQCERGSSGMKVWPVVTTEVKAR